MMCMIEVCVRMNTFSLRWNGRIDLPGQVIDMEVEVHSSCQLGIHLLLLCASCQRRAM